MAICEVIDEIVWVVDMCVLTTIDVTWFLVLLLLFLLCWMMVVTVVYVVCRVCCWCWACFCRVCCLSWACFLSGVLLVLGLFFCWVCCLYLFCLFLSGMLFVFILSFCRVCYFYLTSFFITCVLYVGCFVCVKLWIIGIGDWIPLYYIYIVYATLTFAPGRAEVNVTLTVLALRLRYWAFYFCWILSS